MTDTPDQLKTELAHRQTMNDELLHMLLMMERLWPDDEKPQVQSLISQAEATRNVLRDLAGELEKKT